MWLGIPKMTAAKVTASTYPLALSVILDRGSEGRMRLPSAVSAALSTRSTKPLIFRATDFVRLQNKTCQLNGVKISRAAHQQNRGSGCGFLQRKG